MNWEEPKRQAWFNPRVVAWALFDIGATIFSMTVISRYLGPWIVQEKGGSVLAFNATMSISMIVAGIIQVVLSPISDELGKRKIFVFTFSIIHIAACAMMSFSTTLAQSLVAFAIANIGYQTALVFYFAMLGDVADERHTARIAGIGTGVGYIGSVLGLVFSAGYVDMDLQVFSPVFWRVSVAVFGFALPLFLFVREKPGLVRFNLSQSLTNSVGSFMTTLRRVGRNREMLFFFLGCLLALDALHTVSLNMSLYCQNVVGLDAKQGFSIAWKDGIHRFNVSELDAFLITSAFFAIIGAPIIGHIADKTDRYKCLLAVVALWMFTLVLAMFSVQRKLFWITGPLFGLGFGGLWTVSRAYLLDLCHPEERSQMFAIFGLVGKGAAVIGPLVWGLTFKFMHVYAHVPERRAYRFCLFAIFLLTVFGFQVLLKARPRKEKTPFR